MANLNISVNKLLCQLTHEVLDGRHQSFKDSTNEEFKSSKAEGTLFNVNLIR